MSTTAFQLLTIPKCTLSFPGFLEQGVLGLDCVTFANLDASNEVHRDVYLVLTINSSETPIDPARKIQRKDVSDTRVYTFFGTQTDPSELVLTVSLPPNDITSNENIETFEGILAQYADFQDYPPAGSSAGSTNPNVGVQSDKGQKDLRGHLVMVNEETGEVVGEVEDKFKVREDPTMNMKGHENDPVVIEVPDEYTRGSDAEALEVFVRLVPPDQQDWITKSATVVSQAISTTTNLLLTTITSASSYYISHSSPSPHHSNANSPAPTPGSKSPVPGSPPPPPSRALVFLTSESTRKGLSTVHAVSGKAVEVSAKTVGVIDQMIRKAMGGKEKRTKAQFHTPSPSTQAPLPGAPRLPPRSPSPGGSYLAPPPYPGMAKEKSAEKPPLPPRGSTSSPTPVPPRTGSGIPDHLIHAPQPRLTTKDRFLLSADLILSTLDDSTRRLLDTGTASLGKVVGHKYGPEAARNSVLMAGTARNVALVYVDMRGVGRRALLKRAGKNFVRARVGGKTPEIQPQSSSSR